MFVIFRTVKLAIGPSLRQENINHAAYKRIARVTGW